MGWFKLVDIQPQILIDFYALTLQEKDYKRKFEFNFHIAV